MILDIRFESADHVKKEYEKTIIFKVDDNNRSFFNEEGGTSQYAFVFTMVKNDQNQYVAHTIRHNGIVVASGSNIESQMNAALAVMRSSLKVNEAYAYDPVNLPDGLEFEKWRRGTNYYTDAQMTFSALETIAKENSNSDSVTISAVLKVH